MFILLYISISGKRALAFRIINVRLSETNVLMIHCPANTEYNIDVMAYNVYMCNINII
jgi:hypothetical protein